VRLSVAIYRYHCSDGQFVHVAVDRRRDPFVDWYVRPE